MTAAVDEIRPARDAEWDAAWEACGHATYFHSREWSELWRAYTRGAMRPDPIVITLSSGRSVLVPLTRENRRPRRGPRYWSSPAGTFGGWLADVRLEADEVTALGAALIEARPNLWWRLNPYDADCAVLADAAVAPDDTHALHLTRGYDSVCATATHGHRCNVRKAEKEGVCVRLAETEDDWRAYYAIYEDSLRRWGDTATSRYEWPLFAAMAGLASERVRLYLAEFDGRVISGGICLSSARHVAYWHAATLGDFFSLRPANLLVSAMVAESCERGAEWFDFNPSGGHEGVRVFKERCGASPLPCPVVSTFESPDPPGTALARGAGWIRSVVERRPAKGGEAAGRGRQCRR